MVMEKVTTVTSDRSHNTMTVISYLWWVKTT